MKSLIVVAGYASDNGKKIIEIELLSKLNKIKDRYDILYISHKPISDIIYDYIDYGIFDKKNSLIFDPKYKPKVWYGNDNFGIVSTQFFRKSTHISIFRMMSIANNFAKTIKYKKIHYIEYDLNLENTDIINKVDDELNDNDSVCFINKDNNWFFGCYFAWNLNKYSFLDNFDKQTFLRFLEPTNNNFTETSLRRLFFEDKKVKTFYSQDHFNGRGQKVKSLTNQETLDWCVPYYDFDSEEFNFLLNVDKEVDLKIHVIVNDEKIITFNTNDLNLNNFYTKPIGNKDYVKKIEVRYNDKRDYIIDFEKINKEEFINYNNKVRK